ncbi:MAG TPA: calcium/sodium antiporter [Candidatus Sulfomarinibacteraceae bacterium]|nr:calcium/sodium antiporter [Candidatus Sulfomarinibacteraceae bacterium]
MGLEPLLPWAMVVVGIVGLGLGASWLVDGASRLALRLGVSPMVVGLTVVGFGTSMPEFAVSVRAAVFGSGALSVGNAVGSNIMNLLLVLGVAAAVKPIHVVGGERVLRRDLIFGLVPALLIMAAAWNGYISRPVGLSLIAIFAVFIAVALGSAARPSSGRTVVRGSPLAHLGLTVVGIIVLVGGSELMVRGGVEIALRFGVSEAVIGLTLVAFGTSLPELATSVTAALKGESEISIGNVLGSNIFNLGLVVGTAFTIRPAVVPEFVIRQDIPFLVLATVFVGRVVVRDGRISRAEGALLIAIVVAYTVFVVIRGG